MGAVAHWSLASVIAWSLCGCSTSPSAPAPDPDPWEPRMLDIVVNSPGWAVEDALAQVPGARIVFSADCMAWWAADVLEGLVECHELTRSVVMERFWLAVAGGLAAPEHALARDVAGVVSAVLRGGDLPLPATAQPQATPPHIVRWVHESRRLLEGVGYESKMFAQDGVALQFPAWALGPRGAYLRDELRSLWVAVQFLRVVERAHGDAIRAAVGTLLESDEEVAAAYADLRGLAACREKMWGEFRDPLWSAGASTGFLEPWTTSSDARWVDEVSLERRPLAPTEWIQGALRAGLSVDDDGSLRFAILRACEGLRDESATPALPDPQRAWWHGRRWESAGYLYVALREQDALGNVVRLLRTDDPDGLIVDPAVAFYRALGESMARAEEVAAAVSVIAQGMETRRGRTTLLPERDVEATMQSVRQCRAACSAAVTAIERAGTVDATRAKLVLMEALSGPMKWIGTTPPVLRVAEWTNVRRSTVRVALLDVVVDGECVPAVAPVVGWTLGWR